MTVDIYVHANDENLWQKGKALGLRDEALRMFSFAAYEVKLTLDVNPKTGEASITHVDGRPLDRPDETRCPHGAEKDGAYQCPDCTKPVANQNQLSVTDRLHRWYDWAESVLQPLGVGATDENMRQYIAEQFITRRNQR